MEQYLVKTNSFHFKLMEIALGKHERDVYVSDVLGIASDGAGGNVVLSQEEIDERNPYKAWREMHDDAAARQKVEERSAAEASDRARKAAKREEELEHAKKLAKIEIETHAAKARIASEIAVGRKRPHRKPKTASQRRHENKIRELSDQGLEGLAYCFAMKAAREQTPPYMQVVGCPREYPDAYKMPKFCKRINDEKTRVCRK